MANAMSLYQLIGGCLAEQHLAVDDVDGAAASFVDSGLLLFCLPGWMMSGSSGTLPEAMAALHLCL